MPVLLAWIICPIVFGICFLLQTTYFIYKLIKSRQVDQSGKTPLTTISMSDMEATFCMGWAWTSCIDKRTNRITLKTFIAWYIVALSIDIIVTVVFYLFLDHYHRIYV